MPRALVIVCAERLLSNDPFVCAAGEDDLPSPGYMSSAPKGLGKHRAGEKSRVFQGGFYQDLHKMLDVSSGGEVSVRCTCALLAGEVWCMPCSPDSRVCINPRPHSFHCSLVRNWLALLLHSLAYICGSGQWSVAGSPVAP